MGENWGRVAWQQCKMNWETLNQRGRISKEETNIPIVTALHMRYLKNKPTVRQEAFCHTEVILSYPPVNSNWRKVQQKMRNK